MVDLNILKEETNIIIFPDGQLFYGDISHDMLIYNTVREHEKTIQQIECNMDANGKRCVFDVENTLSDTTPRFIDVSKLKNPIELFL